ncbi:MAG: tRNA (adenosine(37)-N6)-dimethylallyltransferase MiaA [Verrucomicrobiaceae bacterium]
MRSPVYLCGPTASGKSATAIRVAQALDGEIVNGDAFQVYRGLEVLSAAPTPDELSLVPHHLYGILPLTESFDAAQYETLARPVIAEIASRGKLPIVVGGSGLYLKFLTHGRTEAPPGDPELRAKLEKIPVAEIYRQLLELDPEEAARQNSGNHRHLSRALEICLLTGKKASELRKNFAEATHEADLRGFVLQWPREQLIQRIAQRTPLMLKNGAIEEVRALPQNAATVKQAIGVKEIQSHLNGDIDYETCLELITISTRQYAKRQANWFRRESWLTPVTSAQEIISHLSLP